MVSWTDPTTVDKFCPHDEACSKASGLLRKLRQPVRHQGHAPLTSITDLPRFICLDSCMLSRLPIALLTLAYSKLTGNCSPFCGGTAVPAFQMAVRISSYRQYWTFCRFPLYGLSGHVSGDDISTLRGGLMGSCSSTFQHSILEIVLA